MASSLSSLFSSFLSPPPPAPALSFPLLDCPAPALATIATFLPFPSALALSHTCTELRDLNAWVEICRTGGLPPLPDDLRANPSASLRHVVTEARKRAEQLQTKFDIAWGGDERYWRRGVPIEGGEYFSAAVLRHVWWFDVRVKLDCYGSMRHFVFFRVKKLNSPYGFGELHCELAVSAHENVARYSTSVPHERLSTRRFPNNVWLWLCVGAVELTARADAASLPTAVVTATIRDHDGTMKSDAAFSHALCIREDLMTRTQREATSQGVLRTLAFDV